MSPPLFAALAPILYCFATRRPYGLDCHTAAFMHPRFKRWQWLQAAMERRAAVNIVHNEHLRDVVVGRGGKAVVVPDVPVVYQDHEAYELSNRFNVTAVCSFNADEPIDSIMDAARRLPEIQFYMTGNPRHLKEEHKSEIPPNVILTGFISDAAYGALIQQSDVVMSLTTRDHTMLRGAWEASYQGTPVIVSDWPILKQAFHLGAIHVENSSASIAAGIVEAQENLAALAGEAEQGRQSRIQRWDAIREMLVGSLWENSQDRPVVFNSKLDPKP